MTASPISWDDLSYGLKCKMQVFAHLTCLSISVSDSQIYYKVIKEIEPGEELLVYLKEGGYSLGNMAPSMEGKASFCQTGLSAPLTSTPGMLGSSLSAELGQSPAPGPAPPVTVNMLCSMSLSVKDSQFY